MITRVAPLTLFTGLSMFAGAHSQHHRRRLTPNTSIINALNEQLASGVEKPHFTLTANFDDGGSLFVNNQQVEIDVVLTEPSVTQLTSYSIDGGASTFVNTTAKYFVSDQSASETLSDIFSILVIDEDKGVVSGLVQKDGKLLNLEQQQGKPTLVTEVNYEPPRDWECRAVDSHHAPVAKDPTDPNGRRLNEKHLRNENHHHTDPNHVHHDQPHTINLSDIHHEDILAQLRNINPNILRNRRRASTNSNIWSYQVDLYIEIDGALVNKHDPNNAANMPNTIAYINALITAASSIYEREVDTHCECLGTTIRVL
jgi:hypothetical protein